MFPDSLENIKENKWVSLTIQSSLLGLNVLLVSQGKVNSYILLSITFVFSLFAMQFVSPRILYFHPFNSHVQRLTFHIDTFLLYAFTFLSGILFFIGMATTNQIEILTNIDPKIKNYVLWIFCLVAIVLPLYLKFFGRTQIRKSIAKRFKNKSFQYQGKCNECGDPGARYENIVIGWNDLRIRMACKSCGAKEFNTNLVIG